MLNTKEQMKSTEMNTIQQEALFTDLTPEAAAIVEGGNSFNESVYFDSYHFTKLFHVKSGTDIVLRSNVNSDPGNLSFNARVTNVDTGRRTTAKLVPTNANQSYETVWTNMRGGTYRIDLRDNTDDKLVRGQIKVEYVS